jgi:hypothetical protein
MKPANNFLHFNNGFPHVKLDQTTWRGIPVNHFQSCQDWPELNANILIDYYFKGRLKAKKMSKINVKIKKKYFSS